MGGRGPGWSYIQETEDEGVNDYEGMNGWICPDLKI